MVLAGDMLTTFTGALVTLKACCLPDQYQERIRRLGDFIEAAIAHPACGDPDCSDCTRIRTKEDSLVQLGVDFSLLTELRGWLLAADAHEKESLVGALTV